VGRVAAVTVWEPCYCSREDAQRAIDFKDGITAEIQGKTDRAIQSVSRNIEGHLHRLFYPDDGVRWEDYPNYQRVSPWELFLDGISKQILCLTAFSSGGVGIPLNTCFLRPANKRYGFPWTKIELDRSSGSTFGGNSQTPQNAIMMTGTWGFTADADPAGSLASAVTSSTDPILVTDASQMGVGDLLILGYGRGEAPYPDDTLGHAGTIAPYVGERVLVSDRQAADTGLQQSGDGCSTVSSSDTQLAWTGSGNPPCQGEVLLLDTEQMLVQMVSAAGVATVERAWNGTVLQAHSGAEIWAYRSLTVQRGFLGTAAAAWDSGTAVYRHRVPQMIRDLAIGEAVNRLLQETAGYSRMVGSGDAARPASGMALADLWEECRTEYGRQARSRAI
jgi:hypothetical protein